jgi:hypothetical protein
MVGNSERMKILGGPNLGYKDTLKGNSMKSVDWIHLAQDMDHWWAFVWSVMNLWVQQDIGCFVTDELSALQKVLCSME